MSGKWVCLLNLSPLLFSLAKLGLVNGKSMVVLSLEALGTFASSVLKFYELVS